MAVARSSSRSLYITLLHIARHASCSSLLDSPQSIAQLPVFQHPSRLIPQQVDVFLRWSGPDARRGLSSRGGKSKSKTRSAPSEAEKVSDKEAALQATLSNIAHTFGNDAVVWLGRDKESGQVPVISTGSLALDAALGVGGFPKGRVVEIYGPEASGKTTLSLHVIAEAQKEGGCCVFIDAEHALDPSLAEAIGVRTKDLLIAQPDSGEQALSLVDHFICSGAVDVVVVDSVAALVPKSELEGEMGDAHMAVQARLMSQALRKLTHSISTSKTVLIFINQTRSKLGSFGFGSGPTEVTPGGNALKFYASVRLNIRRIGQLKRGEETIGSNTLVKVVKNKVAPPFKTAEFEIEFGKGISKEGEILDHALKFGFIKKSGGWLSYNDESMGNGKENAKKYLRENLELRETLLIRIKEQLKHSGGGELPVYMRDADDTESGIEPHSLGLVV